MPVEANAFHTTNGCSLHQQQIGVRSSVKPVVPAMRMIAAVDAYTRLTRMGNYWMRIILAVLPWVRANLRRSSEPPPWHTNEAAGVRRRLLMDLFWSRPKQKKDQTERQSTGGQARGAIANRVRYDDKLRAHRRSPQAPLLARARSLPVQGLRGQRQTLHSCPCGHGVSLQR